MMSSPARQLTKVELLVAGFIRRIENLISHNLLNVILDDEFLLWYHFYKALHQLGISYNDGFRVSRIGIMDVESQEVVEYKFAGQDSAKCISGEDLILKIPEKLPQQFIKYKTCK